MELNLQKCYYFKKYQQSQQRSTTFSRRRRSCRRSSTDEVDLERQRIWNATQKIRLHSRYSMGQNVDLEYLYRETHLATLISFFNVRALLT
jgi:hypothetical protein